MSVRKLPACISALLAVAACHARDASPTLLRAGCAVRPGGSRWAGTHYVKAAELRGDEQAGPLSPPGSVVASDSTVLVHEPAAGRVLLLTRDLQVRGFIGGAGTGPGHLVADPVAPYALHHWLSVRGDTLFVYDGRALSLFSLPEGRFLGDLMGDPGVGGFGWFGIHASAKGVVFDTTGPRGVPSVFGLRVLSGGRTRRLLSLALQAFPTRSRSTFVGPDEALPIWAAHSDCVVASDGASEWLARANAGDAEVDTIRIRLPDRKPPPVDLVALGRQAGLVGAAPRPARLVRVRALALDPDGYVWILPVQPTPVIHGGVEVIRIPLGPGQSEIDTVPAFPRAFGAPGSYYGYVRGSDRDRHLARVDVVATSDR